jgi:DegV family protein with EDD domain
MGKVAISADSVSLTTEMAREHGFNLIPCPIVMDGKKYLDKDIDIDELYARLDTKENLPKTSTANLEEILEFFTEISKEGESILHIGMSSVFSPQYKNALQAKDLAKGKLPRTRIEVVDSRTIGIGVHLIAIEAAKAAAQGRSLDEIIKLVNGTTPGVRALTARDTLFYYDKGGRIFEAHSWAEAEEATSFRSIVEVDASTEGTVKPVARAKTVAQIMDKLVEITREKGNGHSLHGAIGYTRGADERAEKLKEMLLAELKFGWLYTAEEGASVAVHNGRGCLDYAFCNEA